MILISGLGSLFFFSCHHETNKQIKLWTENQKRKYFIDSIAYRYGSGRVKLNNFDVFIDSLYPEIKAKNKHNPFVYAFEEPYIDTTKIDSSKNWIRIILDPCWRIPTCITLEKKYGMSYLTSKITNGSGGYFTGILICTLSETSSDSLYDNISKELHKIRFWNLHDEKFDCDDGETWYFESMENGKYNCVMRRCLRKNEKNSTRANLYQIGRHFLKLGKIFSENYVELMPYEIDYKFMKSIVDTNLFRRKKIERP